MRAAVAMVLIAVLAVPAVAQSLRITSGDSATDGLVAWWSYVDGDYRDRMGTHHSTSATGLTIESSRNGSGVRRSNHSQYYVVADHNDLEFGNGTTDTPFSISLWARVNADISSGNGVWVINKRDDAGGPKTEWQMSISLAEKFGTTLFSRASGSIYIIAQGSALTVGKWRQVVFSYDGSSTTNGMLYYADGVADPATYTIAGTYVAMTNSASDVVVGAPGWSRTTSSFPGNYSMDDLRVYRRALTPGEIRAMYNSRKHLYGGE